MDSPIPVRISTILVVDDDSDIRDCLNVFLSSKGYRVVCAANRDDALAHVLRQPVDVVLVDWFMSGMSLEVFVEKLREVARSPSLIVTSAGDQLSVKCEELSVENYIAKPIDIDKLHLVIRRCLSESRRRLCR